MTHLRRSEASAELRRRAPAARWRPGSDALRVWGCVVPKNEKMSRPGKKTEKRPGDPPRGESGVETALYGLPVPGSLSACDTLEPRL